MHKRRVLRIRITIVRGSGILKTSEAHVALESEFYMYSASMTARSTFFYPICMGDFIYEPEYYQHRNSYDSFELMYISSGNMTYDLDGREEKAEAGSMLLLDCYLPHGYWTSSGWEAVWLHFDGPMARAYYQLITSRFGNLLPMNESSPAVRGLRHLYEVFSSNEPIREAMISKLITDILTSLLLLKQADAECDSNAERIEEAVSYIGEHFAEDISVGDMAAHAMLSTFHFIRLFKAATGFTPHEYLVNTRIDTARFLLKTTGDSPKQICFSTGFSSESAFCTCFRKKTGKTPTGYRRSFADR
jgi:AraC family transcriptional regulator